MKFEMIFFLIPIVYHIVIIVLNTNCFFVTSKLQNNVALFAWLFEILPPGI